MRKLKTDSAARADVDALRWLGGSAKKPSEDCQSSCKVTGQLAVPSYTHDIQSLPH